MSARPSRGRFLAGFILGAVLAAAATAGAQGACVRMAGGDGLPPGGSGFVTRTNGTLTEMRATVSPTTSPMPMLASGARQNALAISCPS
ncbi:MAG: hypothetical protein K2X11_15480 [Acetobacteraceae bacterium]|nr:hypothetical protein [Acetobacteraceae bacterium]